MTFLGVLAAQVIRYVSLNIEIVIPLCVAYTAPHENVVSKHLKGIVIFNIYIYIYIYIKQSHYRPGQAQTVPGS